MDSAGLSTETGQTCIDCGSEVRDRFCPACGQRQSGRITFRRVVREAVEHVLSLDSALLRTFVDLWRRPGKVCRDYVAGRRKTYMNPLKYVFLAATVFAVVINLLGALPANIPADNERAVKLFRTIVSALGYLAYLYMLPVALIQSALFRRQGTGAAECYAALLFFYAQFLLLGSTLAVFGLYSAPHGQLTMRGLGLLYFLWLLAGFYRSPRLATFAKGVLVYLAFTAASMASGIAVAMLMRGRL